MSIYRIVVRFLIVAVSTLSLEYSLVYGENLTPQKGQIVSPGTLYRLGSNDKDVLSIVKDNLTSKVKEKELKDLIGKALNNSSIPKETDGVAIVLYQPKVARVVVVRRGTDLTKTLTEAVLGIRKHKRISQFRLKGDSAKARVQIDLISTKPTPIDLAKAELFVLSPQRFEFGIDGLIVNSTTPKKSSYLLPGDSFVRSRLGFRQMDRQIRSDLKLKSTTNLTYKKFQTYSFISYKNDWLELYRGYPFPWAISKKDIEQAAVEGAKHLIRYQQKNGKFLYYYNAAKDSLVDHEHVDKDPEKDGYYNLIRHLSGVPFLLRYYDLSKDNSILPRLEKALWYATAFIKKYPLPDGTTAAYVYQYKKSKLGSAGVFLFALNSYQRVAKVNKFDTLIEQLTRHLLREIYDSGEFRYYSIYEDKEVTPEMNKQHFDFYYPGEALLGLISYIQNKDPKDKLGLVVREKIRKALTFLIHERPKKYEGQFPSLSMDAWLVMAINELWSEPEFQKPDYLNFAFEHADAVIRQQYRIDNSLYVDYPGSYYYDYGDYSFPDGARAEGVMAALKLAVKVNDQVHIDRYRDALQITNRSTYFLVNTPQSVYSVPNPEKTLGGIRFKQTRQWFRIDTIAHPANVYFDFLPYWNDEKDKETVDAIIREMSSRKAGALLMTPATPVQAKKDLEKHTQ